MGDARKRWEEKKKAYCRLNRIKYSPPKPPQLAEVLKKKQEAIEKEKKAIEEARIQAIQRVKAEREKERSNELREKERKELQALSHMAEAEVRMRKKFKARENRKYIKDLKVQLSKDTRAFKKQHEALVRQLGSGKVIKEEIYVPLSVSESTFTEKETPQNRRLLGVMMMNT